MTTIILNSNDDAFGFDVQDEPGHMLQTDSGAANGGNDAGFRPMQLLLAALGSCSAIDIISILKKQRQTIEHFKIVVQGEREKDVIPSLWKKVSVVFYLYGTIDADKAQKAVNLSMEKYCSVAETLRRSGTHITWQLHLNETHDANITED